MFVYGLDPGTEQSALVVYDAARGRIRLHATLPNAKLLAHDLDPDVRMDATAALVIEEFECYGMAVGREVLQAVLWSGRFYQAWGSVRTAHLLPRRAVKLHLCHSARATDANIRQAILDRFGPSKLAAIGTKKQPGPLYGVKGHEYAALAVALTWADTQQPATRHEAPLLEAGR